MSVPEYKASDSVDLAQVTDFSKLAKKSVIVTGGASGLGKSYATAFVHAGAFVTVADYDVKGGEQAVSELGSNAQFVKCDVRSWEDQVAVFESAVSNSPSKGVDIVIANAGMNQEDDLFTLQDPSQPPVKPDLKVLDVNLIGPIYTAKLAIHYFRRQPDDDEHDRCLILKSSMAGYIDMPPYPQYNVSKFGVRGLMRTLRHGTWREGIRVNVVAPWYVVTPIISDLAVRFLESKGVKFATKEDCASAMLSIASMRDLNGKSDIYIYINLCRIKIHQSLTSNNIGKSFAIVPRALFGTGIIDLGLDDYSDKDVLKELHDLIRIVSPTAMKEG
ncbi:NAD(P)-dependent dehydrogenase, short-chain alcohol dehydrogenase family [Geosmithia morbida]|uniref:NAD(P)-dependent dehydrogenase, short-chain alcohol dehydrogenase family n=1 Tax=Geosmithia morbida TaxID=1094350 RepID=A0A9P4YTF0_9HYPO|nr:NAD(P)-dependent dehydrogenase, short-chain alcohol dehydrogenase family [Geosmithia morbida]KAF4121449.1 NAD(P)-dependent dehydrogenase, short-chain alcohol dehydrogenase family [Geosmithia morbida]